LLGWFEYTKAELRKVMKGAMTPLTKFCSDGGPSRIHEIMRLVELLNSERLVDVQDAISELVDHQVFAELFWTSMMMPIAGLTDGIQSGRVADFFVEEIWTSTKCLAKCPVCYLLILIYQTMLIIWKKHLGKDRQKELTIYRDHKAMPDVLMAALSPMYIKPYSFPQFTQAVIRLPFIQYENVLHFDPKTKLPRTIGKAKIPRTMDVLEPIGVFEGGHTNSLPNNTGFQYFRSLSDVLFNVTSFTTNVRSPTFLFAPYFSAFTVTGCARLRGNTSQYVEFEWSEVVLFVLVFLVQSLSSPILPSGVSIHAWEVDHIALGKVKPDLFVVKCAGSPFRSGIGLYDHTMLTALQVKVSQIACLSDA
ncbi:hypothetical protein BDR05DRAFT_954096, partial [Suillus weaverae]